MQADKAVQSGQSLDFVARFELGIGLVYLSLLSQNSSSGAPFKLFVVTNRLVPSTRVDLVAGFAVDLFTRPAYGGVFGVVGTAAQKKSRSHKKAGKNRR